MPEVTHLAYGLEERVDPFRMADILAKKRHSLLRPFLLLNSEF
jgi:hypothetical protein